MIKSITTFILCVALISSLGYIAIEWNHDKFMKLCAERPALKGCPDREIGGAL